MSIKRKLAVPAAAALAAASFAVPASAGAASSHWSKGQCKSYVSAFHKSHSKASAKQKAAANRTLKGKGCSVKV